MVVAVKVERSSFAGWHQHPVYRCKTSADWHEVTSWMYQNGVESFLLSSGSCGYIFQVRTRHEWFILRWS